MKVWWAWIPPWLQEWGRQYLLPLLQVEVRRLLWVLLQGALETFLLFALPTAAVIGSQKVWESRYRLTPAQQETVARWAPVADAVARLEDVPPVTPLVLWYKEGGLRRSTPPTARDYGPLFGGPLRTVAMFHARPHQRCVSGPPVAPRRRDFQGTLSRSPLHHHLP
jgi:hypothetical protein